MGAPVTPRPPGDRQSLGAVYTPDALAAWVATLVAAHATRPVGTVLDPACGHGALLAAADTAFGGRACLLGFDVSPEAVTAVTAAWPDRATTRVADTLDVPAPDVSGVDAVVMNPPWGARTAQAPAALRDAGYDLAAGQYDSWDLFVEWAARRLPEGTVVGAIVPDSLFLPEHTATRRLLVERTGLRVVARLGEGWFEGVFRGVAVVVFVVGAPEPGQVVQCVRLPHDERRLVLAGELDLGLAAARNATPVAQSTWASDDAAITVPLTSTDSVVGARFTARAGDWVRWVEVGRGVEMGKRGRLIHCTRCGWHTTLPKALPQPCVRCGSSGRWAPVEAVRAGMPEDLDGWAPLIVGEDVRRYDVAPSRWLRLGLDGLDYKAAPVYARRKLLVRKTGLGLNAAVDESGSLTTQVVYHYLATPDAPEFWLDYLQGVLCSRPMLAFHLAASGETEWRSHPYVTPRVLARLPIPVPAPDTPEWAQARAVAALSRAARGAPAAARPALELEVDRHVAGLYELDDATCAWVGDVLAATQRLRAFSALVLDDPACLRPVRVA